MAKAPKFSSGFANALLNGSDLTTLFDGGTMDCYADDGTRPANADATEAGGGTLLASVALPASNAFEASAAGGAIAKAGTWQDPAADADGTFSWFRLREAGDGGGASSTAVRIDGTMGVTAGQFDAVSDTADTITGVAVVIDSLTISIPVS